MKVYVVNLFTNSGWGTRIDNYEVLVDTKVAAAMMKLLVLPYFTQDTMLKKSARTLQPLIIALRLQESMH